VTTILVSEAHLAGQDALGLSQLGRRRLEVRVIEDHRGGVRHARFQNGTDDPVCLLRLWGRCRASRAV
jgi:hypothetical protein